MGTRRIPMALSRRPPGKALWALLALSAALAGCERQAPAEATGPPAAAPAGRTVEVRLRRFECEEKCWLEVELADSSVISGLCSAAVCVQWLDNGTRLPAALVGCRARILLRQDKVFVGTEEDRLEAEDFRAITLLD
jgi:hypothetical protein